MEQEGIVTEKRYRLTRREKSRRSGTGGCDGNGIVRETSVHDADRRFICDSDAYSFETVVDSHTGVTYLIWKSGSYRGGITVLLNRDGTPVMSEEV